MLPSLFLGRILCVCAVQHSHTAFRLLSSVPALCSSHYEVELRPDLAAATFSASVKISIDVKSGTKTVVLNAAELVVQKASFAAKGGAALSSQSIECNEADEVMTLTFGSELPVGPATLDLQYTGILNDQMRGFYLSKYKDAAGVERSLCTTQFEATDCRRAIPSWDEPAIKATFAVSIVCPTGLTALSNMPTTHSTVLVEDPKLTRHVFDTTVPMSTYLLAFIVGEFDMIEGTSSEGTLVRCFATPGKGEQNRFALEFALQLLPFYSKWFEIPYALPKLDMVAVPDFSAGAMENCNFTRTTSGRTAVGVQIALAHSVLCCVRCECRGSDHLPRGCAVAGSRSLLRADETVGRCVRGTRDCASVVRKSGPFERAAPLSEVEPHVVLTASCAH